MLRYIWKVSYRVGLTPTLVGLGLWLYLLTRIVLVIGPVMALAPLWIVDLACAAACLMVLWGAMMGVLLALWLTRDHLEFRSLGFRIRWVKGQCWLYEERTRNRESRLLPFERVARGDGYPAGCVVYIYAAREWNSRAPAWARNRREQILRRINTCSGCMVEAFEPPRGHSGLNTQSD